MSSVAPNSGIASLIEFLSGAGSPLIASVVSSSTVQSAIENASPADLIQLSSQALQYQQAEGLFSTASSADPVTPTPSAGSFSPSQLASYQSQAQLEQVQTLLGPSGTSVSVLG
ncbi:MAG: hypothetical protein ABSB15_12600 [Bryobacteraceae bacterium]|jgi:hypothetical protein